MTEAEAAHDHGWCERFGASLMAASGQAASPITPRLQARLLTIARDIAHGTERRNAPVCAFIAGRYVEARHAQGVDADAALSEVAEAAARLLRDATP
jgi:Domain of unknown function (DUF6457)